MLCLNMHNLEMTALVRSSEILYNRRVIKVFALEDRRLKFFWYSRSTVYSIAQKYVISEKSEEESVNPTRKIHSKEKTAKTIV